MLSGFIVVSFTGPHLQNLSGTRLELRYAELSCLGLGPQLQNLLLTRESFPEGAAFPH